MAPALAQWSLNRLFCEKDLLERFLTDLPDALGESEHLRCMQFGGGMSNFDVLQWVVDSTRPTIYDELSVSRNCVARP